MLASIAGAVFLSVSSQAALRDAKTREAEARPRAQATVDEAAYADTVIAQAAGVLKNTNLATAMITHNGKYPRLYDTVTRYVPAFYRLTSIAATPGAPPGAAPAGETPAPGAPAGPDATATAIVTMTGVVSTYQQYADLMLALMRVPGAETITRTGYTLIDPIVPNLTSEDQVGRPRPEGAAPIPDDPLRRLEYFQSQGTSQGYLGTGNFGTGSDLARGAMPRDSIVSVTLVVRGFDLRVPDVRGTLTGGGAATPVGGPPTSFGGPSIGGPPTGPGGPPTGPSPTGGGAAAEEDDAGR